MTNFFNQYGLYITIISLALGIIGIIATIRSRRSKTAKYAFDYSTLTGVEHPKIKIQFKGEEIPNVHSFRFVLWNSGTDVIRDDDIPRSGLQPKVTLSEGSKILSTRTFNSNRSQAKRKINDDRFYKFRFDYLNPGDAFMCELICTTESDGEVVATYSGNIIGAKVLKGKRKSLGLNDKLSTTMMLLLFGVAGYYMGSRAVELLLMGEYNKTVGPLLMLLGAVIAFSSLAIFVGKSIMHAMPVAYANFLETGKYEST